jgi:hypothetical protein
MNAPLPAFPVPATVDALPNPIRPAFCKAARTIM